MKRARRPRRKVLHLPAAERRLLVEAALLLEATKLGMWLLPFETPRRLLARMPGARHAARAEGVARAVEAASRGAPGVKTCLAQALAAQAMLARRGCPALLHIGVTKGEQGRLQAHAWVESEGEAVLGAPKPGRYTTLASFKAR